MVRKAIVARKTSYIASKINKLRSHQGPSLNAFSKNDDLQDIILHNLQLAIQACIDMATHIVTDEGWGTPGSFSEVFYLLEENQVISRELGEQLIKMVGFRNRIIHDYEKLDLGIVYNSWHHDIEDIEEFLASVGQYFDL